MRIHEMLEGNIIKDYYTANIKAEVILDTILTPVIDKVLTIIGQKYEKTGIEGEMKLLAKEFPMLKESKENESNYRSCNADYLMCDDNSVYLVELKTMQESFESSQMINYRNYLARFENIKFSNVSGAAFIDLLNHVSKTGYSSSTKYKPWGKTEKDDLKRVFEAVIRYPQYRGWKEEDGKIPVAKDWVKEKAHHVDDAIAYLKETKAVSSKKYLLTAGEMLDHMKEEYGDWWNYDKIKLLYLMPEIPLENEKTEGVVIITFREIMKQTYAIGKEMEKDKEKPDLKKYWDWVMKILIQCGLY